jgi:hypothetical protein
MELGEARELNAFLPPLSDGEMDPDSLEVPKLESLTRETSSSMNADAMDARMDQVGPSLGACPLLDNSPPLAVPRRLALGW